MRGVGRCNARKNLFSFFVSFFSSLPSFNAEVAAGEKLLG